MHRGMTGTLISWPAHSTSAGVEVGKMGRFAQWVAKTRLCAGNSVMRWRAGAGWRDENTANMWVGMSDETSLTIIESSFGRTLETGLALMPANTRSMLKRIRQTIDRLLEESNLLGPKAFQSLANVINMGVNKFRCHSLKRGH
jgi:hypothetical protein